MQPCLLFITLSFFIYMGGDAGHSNAYLDDNSKRPHSRQALNDTLPNILPGQMILITGGQMLPYTMIKIGNSDFKLVTNGTDTVYLSTNDQKFQIPEGYKVGMMLSDLPKDIHHALNKENGWGYHYKLSSGWSLGFCEGNSCTDNYPSADSKVKWIFKRW